MVREIANPKVAELMKSLKCTENQARNALKLSRDDAEMAAAIIKEHRSEDRTTYAGGQSGQILETPKSKYAEEFSKMMQEDAENPPSDSPVERRKLTIFKNGFLIDGKFTRLSDHETKRIMEKIIKKKEVPSDLFNIKQDELVDVEVEDKSGEMYREKCPGDSRTVNLCIPVENKAKIELGDDSIVFKLTIEGKNTIVQMGKCSSFEELKAYLGERGVSGKLYMEDKEVCWNEDPSKYKRTLLRLLQ
ncbi:uncharacterized protein NEMAJ01_0764 [Nematocida major]|uniref:uncharacterized protein n=1 Tax=Nematocida major TaxID=1912982 RepID=UPI002008C5CB|nr:uncharacterized protein NEMAJ01_0764 [Nematocida major]KAH9385868.1 hypothetical protein NEMAJ01_0764 [Nematocida major]